LNWSGDLYGQELCVNLVKFLRPEQKFDSLDALKQQITIDCEAAASVNSAKLTVIL
jgi:riboflavin kinase / FMN adenylyltransferase